MARPRTSGLAVAELQQLVDLQLQGNLLTVVITCTDIARAALSSNPRQIGRAQTALEHAKGVVQTAQQTQLQLQSCGCKWTMKRYRFCPVHGTPLAKETSNDQPA